MKQYITKFLKYLAASFIAFPVVYIFMAATLFDIPLGNCVGIVLSPFYFTVSFSMVLAGYGLWEMRRWSWYVFILAQFLVSYENASLLLIHSESHNKVLAFVICLLFQTMLIYRVSREIRVPYFFPRIRWWESNPRYRLSVPVNLKRKNGESLEGEILDLSVAGCFIKLRQDLDQDELLSLQFKIFGYELGCEGNAVWCAQSTVTHPKGIGMKFRFLQKHQKRSLRFISRRLRKISTLYRRSRYLMSQEEFLKRIHEIETKGRILSQ